MKYGLGLYSDARAAAGLAKSAEEAGWDGFFLGDAIWLQDPMIALAAAAMTTTTIRLGTMLIPAPLHKPWRLASTSLALDHLSNGRLILGLGAGAVWMGWHAFPDEVTDKKARAELLDETIEILTLLYQRQPFDYDGKHFHLKLTQMDVQYYPPKPLQQPRIPLWAPGLWPRKNSLAHAMKCDGMFVEKIDADGKGVEATPDDVRAIKAYVQANRTLTTPFDIVVGGQTRGLDKAQAREKVAAWQAAGATWWVETLFEASEAQMVEFIQQGPP